MLALFHNIIAHLCFYEFIIKASILLYIMLLCTGRIAKKHKCIPVANGLLRFVSVVLFYISITVVQNNVKAA